MTISVVPQNLGNISTWLTPPKSTNLPSALKGIFFMDGNPLPDDCITMDNLEWDDKSFCLSISVAAPLQWTFHRSPLGWVLLLGAWLTRFRYAIQFESRSLVQGQLTPFILGIAVPKWIVNATMWEDESSKNGDTWQRKNLWLGGIPYVGEYVLRRIVDEQGQYTPAFADMLSKVDNDCLVVVR